MNRKAIFIDKDGTLIKDVPYNVNPDLIVFEEAAIEGLKQLVADEFLIVIISNQSGVARGYFDIEMLKAVELKISDLLAKENILLSGFYYCPHHPDGIIQDYSIDCTCRKPMPGMILMAAEDLNIDLSASWMIGDILHDVEAGNKAGCKTVLIDNGNETEWIMTENREPFYTAASLTDAADFILTSVEQRN